MEGRDLLAGAARAATYNMALQLCIRIMTFVLNGVVLRYISKEMLGVVNVRLTLLYTTTLFLATESFDQACLSKIEDKDWRQVVNQMWLTFPMSILVCLVFGCVWMFVLESPDSESIPYYGTGVVCFCLTTIITTLARPHFIIGQCHLFNRLRVISVALSELVRCIIAAFLVIYFPHWGLINFSIAQVVCAITYSAIYYVIFYLMIKTEDTGESFVFQSVRDFFPKILPNKSFVDWRLVSLTRSFFKQSIFKQLLTEGEKYIMTVFGVLSFGDQGVYDIINNLGSMAPRFIFLPIEESSRLFFSCSFSRGQSLRQQSKDSVDLVTSVLEHLLKTVTLIGSIILVFGQSYAFLALDLYGGSLLSAGSGPLLLRWYCLYVLVLAVNGITECFYFAVMSKKEIDSYNHKMLLFSVILLVSSLFLTRLVGSVGFVLANCINMACRIMQSIYFIHNYYKDSGFKPLKGFIPSYPVIGSLAAAYCTTALSESYFCCGYGNLYRLLHIVLGGLCLLGVMITIAIRERELVQFVTTQLWGRKIGKTNF
ncbi:protein RFT1 homolog isoform X1 [Saccostrea echinata]|uniref:protein RFT1 homolog isoform X1 n=1 Tax=Saccostrea echinata TaxID=191078 RepID=UPI002A83442E|nr:protein RFT1 homolog isoform X1 [Saccostrea echinata]